MWATTSIAARKRNGIGSPQRPCPAPSCWPVLTRSSAPDIATRGWTRLAPRTTSTGFWRSISMATRPGTVPSNPSYPHPYPLRPSRHLGYLLALRAVALSIPHPNRHWLTSPWSRSPQPLRFGNNGHCRHKPCNGPWLRHQPFSSWFVNRGGTEYRVPL